MEKIEPREYQNSIFETAKKSNTLVVLPTGTGKTLIAFLLSKYHLETQPTKKVLLLAPTRPLAEQHFEYFKANLPELYAELQLFTGKVEAETRKKLWQIANIIFSTPQCIANDLKRGRIDISDISLLIEDEAHRCLKNYDYTFVARKFLEDPSPKKRILAMTASPGSEEGIIKNICENLGIERIESRSRESVDVQPYLKELVTEIEKVDLPEELIKASTSLKEIYNKNINELKNRSLFYGPPTKRTLLDLQARLIRQISTDKTNFNALRGMSVCAQAIKISHAIELIETQGISSAHKYLQKIIDDANKGVSKAAKNIISNPNFMQAYTELTKVLGSREHPKLERLKEIIQREISENPKARLIIFGQFRDTVSMINKMINKIPGINSRVFVGQMKKDDTGLSQKEQGQVLQEFRERKINVLTSTSIGEEGLDLPEVNCVIFYEPIPSAIRTIQRTGRTARLHPGKLIILLTKKTKDETSYFVSERKERKMHRILRNMKQKFDKKEDDKENMGIETKEMTLNRFIEEQHKK